MCYSDRQDMNDAQNLPRELPISLSISEIHLSIQEIRGALVVILSARDRNPAEPGAAADLHR
jgi:hypothetical protein